jgi:hypothetical protein
MKTSPLQQVKGNFGDKAKLISAVQALATDALWLDRVNKDKGLTKISNSKLIRLHTALSRAKEQFGTRDKLIAAVLTLGKRSGDEGYKTRLATYPIPRLLDLHDSLGKKSGQSASAQAAAKSKTEKRKVARSKKAKLKAA